MNSAFQVALIAMLMRLRDPNYTEQQALARATDMLKKAQSYASLAGVPQ